LLLVRVFPYPRLPYTTLFRSPSPAEHLVGLTHAQKIQLRLLARLLAHALVAIRVVGLHKAAIGALDFQPARIALKAQHCIGFVADRKSTRLNSSHVKTSYAVF